MNKEWKEKWIKALCSGKYKQGRGQLRREDEFCCLGVFCDIYDPNEWRLAGRVKGYVYGDYDDSMFIPREIRDSLDITMLSHRDLIYMNDNGATFEQIADYIEEKL